MARQLRWDDGYSPQIPYEHYPQHYEEVLSGYVTPQYMLKNFNDDDICRIKVNLLNFDYQLDPKVLLE